jgi:histidine triad (HIT) family protein
MTLPIPETDSCYLCGIVEDSTSWNIVHRTDMTMTILNGRQFEIGQCIVFPLRHAPTLLDLTEREGAAVMAAASRVAKVLVDAFEPDGLLLYQNNGVGSGQEVPHFHMHVVPRREGSAWGFGPPHIARLEPPNRPVQQDHRIVTEQKRATAEQLREGLNKAQE